MYQLQFVVYPNCFSSKNTFDCLCTILYKINLKMLSFVFQLSKAKQEEAWQNRNFLFILHVRAFSPNEVHFASL